MVKVKTNATIGKNEPMPSICKLCESVKKHWTKELSDTPQENDCFRENDVSKYPESVRTSILEYQPFTNSKRKVLTVCKSFSHIRTVTITYK